MSKLHIGIVGAGLIAREHSATLTRSKYVGKLSVFDSDAARAGAFSKDIGTGTAPSLDELAKSVDLLWICTPPVAHLQAVQAGCRAGKPIFCEKPLAQNTKEALAIQKVTTAAKVPFFMGQSGRFTDAFIKIKEVVEKGLIGDVVYVWSLRHGYLDRKNQPAWRFEDKSSGGVLVEFGIHEIDFAQWIGGPLKDVSAISTSKILNPGKFTEAVTAVGTFVSGAKAKVEVSWANPRYLWQRGVEGTKGSLFYCDSNFNHVMHVVPGKPPKMIKAGGIHWKDPVTGENMAFKNQAKAVLEALVSGKPAPVGIEAGLLAVKAADAMMKAATSGKNVSVK